MFGYPLVNVLGACLIITSMMVVLARAGRTAAWLYSLQSLVLVGVLASLGFATSATDFMGLSLGGRSAWLGLCVAEKTWPKARLIN